MTVAISGLAGNRVGEIAEGNVAYKAPVQSMPIALLDSIGGDGFIDKIDHKQDGKTIITMLMIRGKIDDDIISFTGAGVRGTCHLIDRQSGSVQ